MNGALRQPGLDLTIAVIGPQDLVERIMLAHTSTAVSSGGAWSAGAASPAVLGLGVTRRLVASTYRSEQEAPDKVLRLASTVDVRLFASPVPLEYARRAGVLGGPATAVPLGGSALFATLARAIRAGHDDLSRASVDVLRRAEVEEAFADLGIPLGGTHIREDAASPAALTAFHERLWRRGQASIAITCLESVAQRLAAAGVPVLAVRPTGSAIRAALRTATLLGGQRRLEEAQLAVVLVEVPALRESARRPGPRLAREELRLTVNRFLVQEAQRIQAGLVPMGEHSFLVTATRGSLSEATDGFRVPPFTGRARRELNIVLEVGIGLGRTAVDAEVHARSALARSQSGPAAKVVIFDREGRALAPLPRSASSPAGHGRAWDTLSRLAAKLPAQESERVVDAERAGQLLGVTSRTARRLLHALVEEGLAWPLPPQRSPQPGRPRQFYRLVTEKLEQRAPS